MAAIGRSRWAKDVPPEQPAATPTVTLTKPRNFLEGDAAPNGSDPTVHVEAALEEVRSRQEEVNTEVQRLQDLQAEGKELERRSLILQRTLEELRKTR